jgi:hypothetical protein
MFIGFFGGSVAAPPPAMPPPAGPGRANRTTSICGHFWRERKYFPAKTESSLHRN